MLNVTRDVNKYAQTDVGVQVHVKCIQACWQVHARLMVAYWYLYIYIYVVFFNAGLDRG